MQSRNPSSAGTLASLQAPRMLLRPLESQSLVVGLVLSVSLALSALALLNSDAKAPQCCFHLRLSFWVAGLGTAFYCILLGLWILHGISHTLRTLLLFGLGVHVGLLVGGFSLHSQVCLICLATCLLSVSANFCVNRNWVTWLLISCPAAVMSYGALRTAAVL
jgi:hypothetical protein